MITITDCNTERKKYIEQNYVVNMHKHTHGCTAYRSVCVCVCNVIVIVWEKHSTD